MKHRYMALLFAGLVGTWLGGCDSPSNDKDDNRQPGKDAQSAGPSQDVVDNGPSSMPDVPDGPDGVLIVPEPRDVLPTDTSGDRIPMPDAIPDSRESPDADVSTDANEPACPGTFGCRCNSSEACYSGFCLETRDGDRCTRTCQTDSSCPEGWRCRGVAATGGTDIAYVCVDPFPRLCRPCIDDSECLPRLGAGGKRHACIPHGPDGSFCGVPCEGPGDCPQGYTCKQAGAIGFESQQCMPSSGECECPDRFLAPGIRTACYRSNAHGKCSAQRTCDVDCPAREPAPETCNDLDDNCDGQTDEGTGGQACSITNAYGTCPGITRCVGGHAFCEGNAPATEVCNGLDDDCDGSTDPEGAIGCRQFFRDDDGDGYGVAGSGRCLCAPGIPWTALVDGDCNDTDPGIHPGSVEKCNGRDDDCDGTTDNDTLDECFPGVCDPDLGACKPVCETPGDCQEGYTCTDGTCRLVPGSPCEFDEACASGFCTDGFCCDSRCRGTCESCDMPARTGSCTPIPLGQDPDYECPAAAPGTCGLTGACSGERTCLFHPAGTACGTTSCASATTMAPAGACDGTGTCLDAPTRDCRPYTCNPFLGRCNVACNLSSDCAAGHECDPATGRCLVSVGYDCTSNNDCTSGACCLGKCRDLRTDRNNCGACNRVCRNDHGTTSCSMGTCRPVCEPEWADCDGIRSNGCETSLRTTTNCGSCGTACSRPNAVASCATGTCELESCSPGKANCDGNPLNGCEFDPGVSSNTCLTAEWLGSHCGDEACGAFCPGTSWSSRTLRSGRGGRWFQGRADECSNCCADIVVRVTLDVPAGVDYDLYVYGGCGRLLASSAKGPGSSEQIVIGNSDDCLNGNSGFDYWIEVRHHSGTTCYPWTVKIDGRTCS